jgi:signal transduction histidine kinase/CheY-like chemotaxis protein
MTPVGKRKNEDITQEHQSGTFEVAIPADRARLIGLTGVDMGRIFRIRGHAVIGRGPMSQVRLTASDVSRRHARIWQHMDETWMIEDCDSRNGTWVNGRPVTSRTRLQFGARVQVGTSVLLIFTHHDFLEEQIYQLQKMESIGKLASEVAHDFNNLLVVINGSVTILRQLVDQWPPPTEEMRENLEEVAAASARAVELTSRLLSFSRRGREEDHTVDVAALAREIMGLCQRTFTSKIETETDFGPELMVMGNPAELHQVLMNLCINARDAMPGGGRLSLAAHRVQVNTSGPVDVALPAAGEYVVISVTDTGVGMDEETSSRIFEPFFTTKGLGEGTGLGLATAFAIVKNHGGRLVVKSKPGRGSTFQVFLPVTSDDRLPRITDQVGPAAEGQSVDRPATVLVVDDDDQLRKIISRYLEELGLEVMTAADGTEAVALFQEHQSEIRLVLLDMVMAEMGGAETFGALRSIDPWIPILLMSGHFVQSEVDALMEQGALGFLPKPYRPEELRRVVLGSLKDSSQAEST